MGAIFPVGIDLHDGNCGVGSNDKRLTHLSYTDSILTYYNQYNKLLKSLRATKNISGSTALCESVTRPSRGESQTHTERFD